MKNIIDQTAVNFGELQHRPAKCETHGEYSEIGRVFFGGKVLWSGCQICLKEKTEEKERINAEILAQETQKKLEKRLNQAGIPKRFRDRNFLNFFASNPDQENALAVSEAFAKNFDEHIISGSSLIFSGKAGTGKTHLALAVAQSIMPNHTAMYLNVMDAVRMIRDTWRKGSDKSETDVLDILGGIDLLIIDEVGVQRGTDDEQIILFDIINRRYRDMRPTIFLTNLNVKGFSDYVTERSFDRLKESGSWITFNWESYRGKIRKN